MTQKAKTVNWRGFAPVSTRRSELSLRSPSKEKFKTLVLTGADAEPIPPTGRHERVRPGITNEGLAPRRWQPRPALRDDLELLTRRRAARSRPAQDWPVS